MTQAPLEWPEGNFFKCLPSVHLNKKNLVPHDPHDTEKGRRTVYRLRRLVDYELTLEDTEKGLPVDEHFAYGAPYSHESGRLTGNRSCFALIRWKNRKIKIGSIQFNSDYNLSVTSIYTRLYAGLYIGLYIPIYI